VRIAWENLSISGCLSFINNLNKLLSKSMLKYFLISLLGGIRENLIAPSSNRSGPPFQLLLGVPLRCSKISSNPLPYHSLYPYRTPKLSA
jgi:hypothetical protein